MIPIGGTAFLCEVNGEFVAICTDIDKAKLLVEQMCQSRRGFRWEREKGRDGLRKLLLWEGTSTDPESCPGMVVELKLNPVSER
jgi:hypothetical protein